MRRMKVCAFVLLAFGLWLGASAEQCGKQNHDVVCPNKLCCSQWGWCGTNEYYCGYGCQSNCWPAPPPPPSPSPPLPPAPLPPPSPSPPLPPAPPGKKDVTDIISADLFDDMLLHRNDPVCPSHGFYTYYAFVVAARSFNGFLTTGNDTIRKRELAAFLGQTSHETTGGWDNAPDGRYAWGYCFINEVNAIASYCVLNFQWPCVPDKKYYGRGPIQISYNYNYGPSGKALGLDLLGNPDLVATDAVVSFKTAIWFWMTPQGNKPSSHDVITDKWQPSNADIAAGRLPGYGVITNIINGGLECGFGPNDRVKDRIGFYKRYSKMLHIELGDNVDCYKQMPFGSGLKLSYEM